MLYPLKFKPQYQYRIWGGSKLRELLGKTDAPEKTGESWEISSVQGSISVVANGYLENNDLEELIEVYMGDLVGDSVYERFGQEFPLLVKFIDANDILSIQVHPDDKLARERHNAYGKTEMWYVLQADPESVIYNGFNQKLDRDAYLNHLHNQSIETIMNEVPAHSGDLFFIPAGRVHATGAGILFAEIQQTSDITYRIYDWDRIDKNGKPRLLHTDLALDAISFEQVTEVKTTYQTHTDQSNLMLRCPYFTSYLLVFSQPLLKDYFKIDSFVILICLEGCFSIETGEDIQVLVCKGETVLIPAAIKQVLLIPSLPSRVIEVYVENLERTDDH